ncbi:hypothetical protein J7T55_009789 [Diaporthe amygdali]|uniref:uncharacterized protein n=1 Tax=Phomopsis amygdali TaxID=1214568 RepID=UPI0022FEAAC5|nr:uncharacterized protein J7T55_009789 [Diaporthe amygdali]KAJ0116639.1 hypothetical protein J7T55_009789 [Diaporthe amygdali]
MGNHTNPLMSFKHSIAKALTMLLITQCSLAWSVDTLWLRGATDLLKRRGPPDPPIPVIDGVQSTKRYIRNPAQNQGAFWSGFPSPLTQSAAAAAGFQKLEQSVAPEILSHPDAKLDSANSGQFWTWMSAGFSETLVENGHNEVTVLLRAPNRLLTGPSDPF